MSCAVVCLQQGSSGWSTTVFGGARRWGGMGFGEEYLTAQLLPFLKQPVYWVCHPCSCKKYSILCAQSGRKRAT